MKNIDSICKTCGLYQYSDNPVIEGKGCSSPRLVLIGEAPGPDEAKKGEVFIGRAGRKLMQMIEPYQDIGIWITNAVKCFPPISTEHPEKGFRVPKLTEIKYCEHKLYPELSVMNPVPVLMPMGNTAYTAITGKKSSITQVLGKVNKLRYGGIEGKDFIAIPNFHPSYILRHPQMESEFIRVMNIAKEYVNVNSGTTGSS